MAFQLAGDYRPRGDQETAIAELVRGLVENEPYQTLLGVTGSGKTFTMAKVIERTNRPALILAHNKTLAAQLYQEFKQFFPQNAVEYFVSYYDYYQPEAYIPSGDIYIEKEATTNDELDKLRLSATRSLFERRDVIIIASVSCIYGLGSPEAYYGMLLMLEKGQKIKREDITREAGRDPLRTQRRRLHSAARFACAATSSRSSRPTTTTRFASSCGATRSRACRRSIRLLGTSSRPTCGCRSIRRRTT